MAWLAERQAVRGLSSQDPSAARIVVCLRRPPTGRKEGHPPSSSCHRRSGRQPGSRRRPLLRPPISTSRPLPSLSILYLTKPIHDPTFTTQRHLAHRGTRRRTFRGLGQTRAAPTDPRLAPVDDRPTNHHHLDPRSTFPASPLSLLRVIHLAMAALTPTSEESISSLLSLEQVRD
jgi:hypothetical protein